MPAIKIAGVVLAAGASSRLGRPKQTVLIHSETLVARAVRVAIEAGLAPVVLVVADETLQVAGAKSILNANAMEGMASSIRCGVSAVSTCDGLVLMTCDQPALTPEHLQALCAESGRMSGSGYAGKVGIPAYFPACIFSELMKLKGDVGARDLLRAVRIIVDEDLTFDIDTEADVARLLTQSAHMPAE